MNREERRRQERNDRQAGRQVEVSRSRLGAEVQDFMAGTIFVHGAAGIHATGAGPDLPPLFVVVVDDHALSVAPGLSELFVTLEVQGTVALNSQIIGTARWGAMPNAGGQMLARLELNLKAPVRTRPSFLLLADNYKQIWDIPATKGYVLGLTTTTRFNALGANNSYSDVLDSCVIITPDPSNAARMLHDHYSSTSEPKLSTELPDTSPAPVLFINGDEINDLRYQVGVARDPQTGEPRFAFMHMRPTGLTQVPTSDDFIPTAISSSFAAKGLHPVDRSSLPPQAEGWVWEENGNDFVVTDAQGVMVATVTPEPEWLEVVRQFQHFVLMVGDELVSDDDTQSSLDGDSRPSYDQMIAGIERNNVVGGVILSRGLHEDLEARLEEDLTPATQADKPLPWWKRWFNRA